MKAKRALKIPGGKFLRMEMEWDELIRSVKLTGDFFLYPEEGIQALEQSLIGMGALVREEQIRERIDHIARERGLQMIGFSPEDVAKLAVLVLTSATQEGS